MGHGIGHKKEFCTENFTTTLKHVKERAYKRKINFIDFSHLPKQNDGGYVAKMLLFLSTSSMGHEIGHKKEFCTENF